MNHAELVAQKARAENNMMFFDEMPKKARDLANQYGLGLVDSLLILYGGNVKKVERHLKSALPNTVRS